MVTRKINGHTVTVQGHRMYIVIDGVDYQVRWLLRDYDPDKAPAKLFLVKHDKDYPFANNHDTYANVTDELMDLVCKKVHILDDPFASHKNKWGVTLVDLEEERHEDKSH
jgi:hypothetical protein